MGYWSYGRVDTFYIQTNLSHIKMVADKWSIDKPWDRINDCKSILSHVYHANVTLHFSGTILISQTMGIISNLKHTSTFFKLISTTRDPFDAIKVDAALPNFWLKFTFWPNYDIQFSDLSFNVFNFPKTVVRIKVVGNYCVFISFINFD